MPNRARFDVRYVLLMVPVSTMLGLSTVRSAPVRDPSTDRLVNYTDEIRQQFEGKAKIVPFDMVAIEGGEFVMGSPLDEANRKADEGPSLRVRVRPFWIGKCEVSWDEFDLFYRTMNIDLTDPDTGRPFTPEEREKRRKESPADAVTRPTMPYVDETYGHGRERHPALCMTHHLAMLYCEWLSHKTGKSYRLPTEAEWEYACRAGSSTPHAIPAGSKLDDYAWYADNSFDRTHPQGTTHAIGTKKPNAWGVHDMHGNVMEWCLDHYVEDAYARFAKAIGTEKFALRPVFLPTEKKWSHVARGGHFKSKAADLRSAARVGSDRKWQRHDPQQPQSIYWLTMMDTIGFRVCRSYEADPVDKLRGRVPKTNDDRFLP